MSSADTGGLPFTSLIRALGVLAGVFMFVGLVSTVVMLLLKWATNSAPAILSIMPMFLLPLGFLALLLALVLAIIRRRAA